MVAALIDEAEKIVAEGIEARLAAADANAAQIAADLAAELREERGEDANHAADKVARIQSLLEG